MKSILQDWVQNLGLRHQGVLLSAVRGCDVVSRHDDVKLLCRCLRAELLVPHCGDVTKSVSYIQQCDGDELFRRMNGVVKDHDALPYHYLMHLVHASEIIGYKSPSNQRTFWCGFYVSMCHKMHMHPETESELDHRLDADEETFAKMQSWHCGILVP